jgi:hypothetical protein
MKYWTEIVTRRRKQMKVKEEKGRWGNWNRGEDGKGKKTKGDRKRERKTAGKE